MFLLKVDNPVEVAIKHMNEPIPSICEYDPEMPQSIENIILRASAKNPKNRYDRHGRCMRIYRRL